MRIQTLILHCVLLAFLVFPTSYALEGSSMNFTITDIHIGELPTEVVEDNIESDAIQVPVSAISSKKEEVPVVPQSNQSQTDEKVRTRETSRPTSSVSIPKIEARNTEEGRDPVPEEIEGAQELKDPIIFTKDSYYYPNRDEIYKDDGVFRKDVLPGENIVNTDDLHSAAQREPESAILHTDVLAYLLIFFVSAYLTRYYIRTKHI